MPSFFRRMTQSLTVTQLQSQFPKKLERPRSSYSDYATVTSTREREFDTSEFKLSFIATDPITEEQMMNQYAIRNLTIPSPAPCRNIKDSSQLKELPRGFYDSSVYEFEEIKQLRNYDDMIASQLGEKQRVEFSRLNLARKKDPFIKASKDQAEYLRSKDFHYSPVRTFEKIGTRPIFEIPLREEKPVVLNKTRIMRMTQITNAIDSSGKWREERRSRLSGGVRL